MLLSRVTAALSRCVPPFASAAKTWSSVPNNPCITTS
eukprot:CAMPEP_0119502194 /NCGR_PEP_ID=MMETSP1344-20130328/23756_1 /TAXON_ID=236787 /ORGANISM="Florenciella parvula, Strain CCMP2471" /LENGTH=36 /DNA_ID= /DNA_START= /DNA_END= /DNA_ORIENTATION=